METARGDDGALRDDLAWRRTALANERTLLAYIRTALALVAAGVTAVQLLETAPWRLIGYVITASGAVTAIIGAVRYDSVKKSLGSPPARRA